MQDTQLNRISNFLWSVSDDLLRDLYVRGSRVPGSGVRVRRLAKR